MVYRALILTAVLGLAVAAGADVARASFVSGGELRHLFPGRFEAVWKDKIDLTLTATADGRLVGGTGFVTASGSWAVRGDVLCISLRRWARAKCGPVRKVGDWYLGLMRADGSPRLRFHRR
jgi:hypothetical protein